MNPLTFKKASCVELYIYVLYILLFENIKSFKDKTG